MCCTVLCNRIDARFSRGAEQAFEEGTYARNWHGKKVVKPLPPSFSIDLLLLLGRLSLSLSLCILLLLLFFGPLLSESLLTSITVVESDFFLYHLSRI